MSNIKQIIEKMDNKIDSLKKDIDKIKETLKILDVADVTFEPESDFGKETFGVYIGNIDEEYKRIFPDCIDTFFYKDSKGRERLDFTLEGEEEFYYFTIIHEGKKDGWNLRLWKDSSKKRIAVKVKIDNPGPWCIEKQVNYCIRNK